MQRTAKKCAKNYNARAQPPFCALNLLFGLVLVAVAVDGLLLWRLHVEYSSWDLKYGCSIYHKCALCWSLLGSVLRQIYEHFLRFMSTFHCEFVLIKDIWPFLIFKHVPKWRFFMPVSLLITIIRKQLHLLQTFKGEFLRVTKFKMIWCSISYQLLVLLFY